MSFMAKDVIRRNGGDLNMQKLEDLQDDATVLGTVADAVGTVAFDRSTKIAKVALTAAAGTTAGAVLTWKNPEAGAIIVTRFVVRLTGVKSGETVDFGAKSTVDTSDTLIDGLSTATAGVFDNITDKGTNGKSRQLLLVDEYITGTASAALTGGTFAGHAYIHYSLV